MRKVLELVPLFALTIIFVQCARNSKRVNIVAMQSHKTTHIQYDSIINMERLREKDIDKKDLLKHMKLQEQAWYGGDFRDDQSKPRYEPVEIDFLLTSRPSKRRHRIFHIGLRDELILKI